MSADLIVVGRVERVGLPALGLKAVPAKVDTGADASSLWCSKTDLIDSQLHCVFFGPGCEFYTGEVHIFRKNDFTITRVASSFGHKEIRYKVKLPMRLKGRTIKATFTLSDRSNKLYPILIGRSTLRGKFLVDVRRGNPLKEQEKARADKLQHELNELKKDLQS